MATAALRLAETAGIEGQFGTVFDILDRMTVRRPLTGEDWEDIFRLRYRAYRAYGYIRPNDEGLDQDKFDFAGNTWVFGFYYDDELVMCFRVHKLDKDNPEGGPSPIAYPEVLLPRIALGQTFIDCSRLVVDPDLDPALNRIAMRFIPFRIAAAAAFYFKSDYILQLIRPSHQAFYRRYFLAENWGRNKTYSTVTFSIDLSATRMGLNDERILRRLPFLRSLKSEQAMLFDEETARRCCYSVRSTAHLALRAMQANANADLRQQQQAATGAAA